MLHPPEKPAKSVTKNRFPLVGCPPNGELQINDRVDMKKANPEYHELMLFRDKQEAQMLEKKKKSKELQADYQKKIMERAKRNQGTWNKAEKTDRDAAAAAK